MAMAEAANHPDGGSVGGSSVGGGGGGGGDNHNVRDTDPSTVPTGNEIINGAGGDGMTPEDAGVAGYTPLEDLEMYGGGVLLPGVAGNDDEGGGGSTFVFAHQLTAAADCVPEDWSDYSDDDDNDRNSRAHGADGAFYADATAFGPNDDDGPSAMRGWTQLSPNGDGVNESNSNGGDGEMDFRAIADRALRSLDDEYMSTRAHGEPAAELSESSTLQSGVHETAVEADERAGDKYAEQDEDDEQLPPSSSDDAPSPQAQLVPPPAARKELPSIDAEAVRRAVQSMRIKSPDLTSSLDDGAERRFQPKVTAPKTHPIIPSAPLAAFRRTSPKAVAATANLSRSATIAEAIVRCLPTLLLPVRAFGPQRFLTVHVVGADHVECQKDDTIRAAFGPLVRWIGAACPSPPAGIDILLLGPNIPREAEGRDPVDLLPPGGAAVSSKIQSATARCINCLYHHYLRRAATARADLVVAFNAGIWGYDEWRPTLAALCDLDAAIPVVVTAYTVQEAEDDADVIAEVVAESKSISKEGDAAADAKNIKGGKCLWEAEANPFGSRKIRDTATAIKCREYHENGAWQAWSFGAITIGSTD